MGRKRVDEALALKALRRIAENKGEYLDLIEADPLSLRDTPLERLYLDLEYVVEASDRLARLAKRSKKIRVEAVIGFEEVDE